MPTFFQASLADLIRTRPIAGPPSRPYVLINKGTESEKNLLGICTPAVARASLIAQADGHNTSGANKIRPARKIG